MNVCEKKIVIVKSNIMWTITYTMAAISHKFVMNRQTRAQPLQHLQQVIALSLAGQATMAYGAIMVATVVESRIKGRCLRSAKWKWDRRCEIYLSSHFSSRGYLKLIPYLRCNTVNEGSRCLGKILQSTVLHRFVQAREQQSTTHFTLLTLGTMSSAHNNNIFGESNRKWAVSLCHL